MFSNQVSYSDTIVYDVGDPFGVLTAGGITESASSVAGGIPSYFLACLARSFFLRYCLVQLPQESASCCVVRTLVSG